MHEIQEKLLELSKRENLATLSLREMAKRIGMPQESPQKIKHHVLQLQKKGFIRVDRLKGVMKRTVSGSSWSDGLLTDVARLISIPIVGSANCGPATIFAEQNFQGFLRVSSSLIRQSSPENLFAIKAEGSSMNRAEVHGKMIEDGDYAIVRKDDSAPRDNEIVLVVVDGKATIKRFIDDRKNGQVILRADSSYDYEPIYLDSSDEFFINGKVIGLIKKH
jgi:SOS-response transcriptional repressor LexA